MSGPAHPSLQLMMAAPAALSPHRQCLAQMGSLTFFGGILVPALFFTYPLKLMRQQDQRPQQRQQQRHWCRRLWLLKRLQLWSPSWVKHWCICWELLPWPINQDQRCSSKGWWGLARSTFFWLLRWHVLRRPV